MLLVMTAYARIPHTLHSVVSAEVGQAAEVVQIILR